MVQVSKKSIRNFLFQIILSVTFFLVRSVASDDSSETPGPAKTHVSLEELRNQDLNQEVYDFPLLDADTPSFQKLLPDDFDYYFVNLDFLIIGFPHSGTTTINRWLSKHPEIWMSKHEDNIFWRGQLSKEIHDTWWREYEENVEVKKEAALLKGQTRKLAQEDDSDSINDETSTRNSSPQRRKSLDGESLTSTNLKGKKVVVKDGKLVVARKSNENKSKTSAQKSGKKVSRIFTGIKDPLLVFSSEVMHYVRFRMRRDNNFKVIYMLRDPLSMVVSWFHNGAPWIGHWGDEMGLQVGFLYDRISLANRVLLGIFQESCWNYNI